MVRETGHTDTANSENTTPGKGALGKAADTIRDLLSDPPHEPGATPVGPGALGLEWK